MVDGQVSVMRLCDRKNLFLIGSKIAPSDFHGRGVDIIDIWGPASLISKHASAYGKAILRTEISGGVKLPAEATNLCSSDGIRMFHKHRTRLLAAPSKIARVTSQYLRLPSS